METLKDFQAMWSLSAWKKRGELAAHNKMKFGSKVLGNPKKLLVEKQKPVENNQLYSLFGNLCDWLKKNILVLLS
jgi:hypothetical protein